MSSLNKPIFDEPGSSFLEKNLYLNKVKDKELRDHLKLNYKDEENRFNKLYACLVNAIFTGPHYKCVFWMSYSTFNRLVAQDSNIKDFKTINGKSYTAFREGLISKGIIKEVRSFNEVTRKAGVYELCSSELLDIFRRCFGDEYVNSMRSLMCENFDSSVKSIANEVSVQVKDESQELIIKMSAPHSNTQDIRSELSPQKSTELRSIITFKSIVLSVFNQDVLGMLSSKNRDNSLDILIQTCKDNGLNRSDLDSKELVELTMLNIKENDSNRSWKKSVQIEFERLIEQHYPRVTVSVSSEEKEYQKAQKLKKIQEERKAFYSQDQVERRARDRAYFESEEFSEAYKKALAEEQGD